MKSAPIVALGLVLIATHARAEDPKGKGVVEPKAATADKDATRNASYGIGLNLGRSLKRQSAEVDADALTRGLRDALTGARPMLSDAQIAEAMRTFQAQVTARQQEVAKAAEDAFLAANAKKEGVKTLPDGLQYKVLKAGDGKSPKATDTVTVHYTGTLLDGTKFDSSLDRGQPASFPVGRVIPGWTEALQLMKVGDKWQIVIPGNLAYGNHPPPSSPIPPHATLIFDVELLGIE